MRTYDKRMIQALRRKPLDRPPFWFMRQAGRYLPEYREVRKNAQNFLHFCYTPDLAVEVTLQPLQRYAMDAAILFSDILVLPDALGQSVEFREGKGPMLAPVRSSQDVGRLERGRVLDHLAPVFEILGRLKEEIPGETALIGFAGAPWTVAVYMVEGRGGTECGTARTWAYRDPEGFQQLIDLLVDATGDYLCQQIDSGAEIIQLFDSWAGVLSETQFRRWVIEPNRRLIDILRDRHPEVPVIGFPQNAGARYPEFVETTGVDGVSLDHGVPLRWTRDIIQPYCTPQGNLDNHLLITGGDEMEAAVVAILETLSSGPSIFNLGHGILPSTPPEHVARVAEIVRAWNGTAA